MSKIDWCYVLIHMTSGQTIEGKCTRENADELRRHRFIEQPPRDHPATWSEILGTQAHKELLTVFTFSLKRGKTVYKLTIPVIAVAAIEISSRAIPTP